MHQAYNEKREMRNNERNKNVHSEKHQIIWRKEKYKFQRILEADTLKQMEMKEKVKKCNIMAEGFRFIYLAFWFS